ncbi:thiamine pyrophosphate-dependent enzyme [Patescibacteria group bacterium]
MSEKNYDSHIKPTWCPGCGNFGIFTALKQAFLDLNIKSHELVIITDVGCSGNLADFVSTYSIHALHGRALPPAAGVKLANHNLPVIAIIGDGGCYGEGLNHFINLMRGNHDITVIVHDNYLYSLTTGQYSPTTPKGTKTKSTPTGSIEVPLNPLALALANSTTFAARGYAFDIKHLTDLFKQAIKHTGFSLVDVLQPCVTFNKTYTVKDWYQKKVYQLKNSFTSKNEAFKQALKYDKLAIGLFWQEQRKAYHEEVDVLLNQPLLKKSIKNINLQKLIEEFI